jgi:prevent-host-death family protein
MKTVGLFEAKTKLSELCTYVSEAQDPVMVTRRGKPWVQITPVKETTKTMRERRAEYMVRYGKEEKNDLQDFTAPARRRERPKTIRLD